MHGVQVGLGLLLADDNMVGNRLEKRGSRGEVEAGERVGEVK